MKKGLLLFMLLLACFVSGCSTFEGFGKDIQKAGHWVEDTADGKDDNK